MAQICINAHIYKDVPVNWTENVFVVHKFWPFNPTLDDVC